VYLQFFIIFKRLKHVTIFQLSYTRSQAVARIADSTASQQTI